MMTTTIMKAGMLKSLTRTVPMNQPNFTLSVWERLSNKPAGKWAFSRLVCWKAPYFGSIRPAFVELRPGYCELHIKKRRAVLNHIGTVHAIAMCNMAELAGGTMSDVTVPSTYRWIPKGMTVEYIKKAETDLKAVAEIKPIPQFGAATELPVTVTVMDTDNQTVFRAVIAMWVSPKKEYDKLINRQYDFRIAFLPITLRPLLVAVSTDRRNTIGKKQTFEPERRMSALPPKADILDQR